MNDESSALRRDLECATAEASKLKRTLLMREMEVERQRQTMEGLRCLTQDLRETLNAISEFGDLLTSRIRDHHERFKTILESEPQRMDPIAQSISLESNGAQARLEPPPTTRATISSDKAFRVLYIEDNLASLALIQQIFVRRQNFKLFSATRGKSAVPLAKQHRPGVILLDLMLPDMHGLEVLQSLREDETTRNIPVVVISADATPSQIERLLTAGARNYVTKPFDVARLLCTLDEIAAEYAREHSVVTPSGLR